MTTLADIASPEAQDDFQELRDGYSRQTKRLRPGRRTRWNVPMGAFRLLRLAIPVTVLNVLRSRRLQLAAAALFAAYGPARITRLDEDFRAIALVVTGIAAIVAGVSMAKPASRPARIAFYALAVLVVILAAFTAGRINLAEDRGSQIPDRTSIAIAAAALALFGLAAAACVRGGFGNRGPRMTAAVAACASVATLLVATASNLEPSG